MYSKILKRNWDREESLAWTSLSSSMRCVVVFKIKTNCFKNERSNSFQYELIICIIFSTGIWIYVYHINLHQFCRKSWNVLGKTMNLKAWFILHYTDAKFLYFLPVSEALLPATSITMITLHDIICCMDLWKFTCLVSSENSMITAFLLLNDKWYFKL